MRKKKVVRFKGVVVKGGRNYFVTIPIILVKSGVAKHGQVVEVIL